MALELSLAELGGVRWAPRDSVPTLPLDLSNSVICHCLRVVSSSSTSMSRAE